MNMKAGFLPNVVGSLLLVLPFAFAAAQDLDDDNAERCIRLNQLDNTEIIDDRNILFYMRGDQAYLNTLPNRCPGLREERTFMYRTTLSQLCDLDVITVLYNQGFGFTPGASCGLGRFYPITKAEADALKEGERKPPARPVAPADPEEVGDRE